MTSKPRFLSRELLQHLYFAGILLLVTALPLSKFVMSVSQFMILGSWILSGDFKAKFKSFISCKPAIALVAIWLMHIIGLLYTTDMDYALKDIRIKLPLLLLPVVFSSSRPLTEKQFDYVLLGLVAGTFIAAVAGFVTWMGWTGRNIIDVRDIALFVSHIRLSLLICLSILVCLWFVTVRHKYAIVLLPVAILLFVFLFILESLTGLVILSIVIFLLGLRRSLNLESGYWKWLMLIISVAIPVSLALYVKSVSSEFSQKQQVDFTTIGKITPSGNVYRHWPERYEYENGNLVWIYVCEEELEAQWNKRSEFEYSGRDRRNQELRFTLIRYMASKGLKKDSAGIWSLTPDDVTSVERGLANVHYSSRSSLYARLHQVLWEIEHYRHGGDPSGHSLTMRWEYWKTAMVIIRQHPFTGVGTGDVKEAFDRQYETDQSRISSEWRLRAHNQYLSIAIAFGIPGLLFFLFVLIYTLRERLRKQDSLFFAFWLIAVMSMVTEDTLETQAGITFFALFYCLFLFVNPQNRACDGNIRA